MCVSLSGEVVAPLCHLEIWWRQGWRGKHLRETHACVYKAESLSPGFSLVFWHLWNVAPVTMVQMAHHHLSSQPVGKVRTGRHIPFLRICNWDVAATTCVHLPALGTQPHLAARKIRKHWSFFGGQITVSDRIYGIAQYEKRALSITLKCA